MTQHSPQNEELCHWHDRDTSDSESDSAPDSDEQSPWGRGRCNFRRLPVRPCACGHWHSVAASASASHWQATGIGSKNSLAGYHWQYPGPFKFALAMLLHIARGCRGGGQ